MFYINAIVFLLWTPLHAGSPQSEKLDDEHTCDSGAHPEFTHKGNRVGIVGAGPAGIHMAHEMKKRGFNVTVLEKTERVGGKSYTLYLTKNGTECEQPEDVKWKDEECVAHEMGTCYLHNGYHEVRRLMEEFGLAPSIVPRGRAMHSKLIGPDFVGIQEFLRVSSKLALRESNVTAPWWWPLSVEVWALISEAKRYCDLHREIFGDYEFALPDRPSPEKLALLDTTLMEFLATNNLKSLIPSVILGQTAMGYGYLSTTPAYYGLLWITPEVMNGVLQEMINRETEGFMSFTLTDTLSQKIAAHLLGGSAARVRRVIQVLPQGFGMLWEQILLQEQLSVKFHVDIEEGGIDRHLHDADAPVTITYLQHGVRHTDEFDVLFYTAPHALAAKYVRDLAPEEDRIFSKLISAVLMTSLYSSAPIRDYSDKNRRTIAYDIDQLWDVSNDGHTYCDRDDRSIRTDEWSFARQVFVSYQYYEHPCTADRILCNPDRFPRDTSPRFDQVPSQWKRLKGSDLFGAPRDELLEQFPWPYFWKHTLEGLRQGLPWDTFDMQGARKTYWIGASAIFESVHDVVNYNLQVLKHKFHRKPQ